MAFRPTLCSKPTDTVGSIEQLDLLAMLIESSDRWWDAVSVGRALGINPGTMQRNLERLATRNLLAVNLGNDVSDRFDPEAPVSVPRARRSPRHSSREALSAILRRQGWPPESPARPLFPVAADRLLRRARRGARHRVACSRLVCAARVPRLDAAGSTTGSFDDFAHAPSDCSGDSNAAKHENFAASFGRRSSRRSKSPAPITSGW